MPCCQPPLLPVSPLLATYAVPIAGFREVGNAKAMLMGAAGAGDCRVYCKSFQPA